MLDGVGHVVLFYRSSTGHRPQLAARLDDNRGPRFSIPIGDATTQRKTLTLSAHKPHSNEPTMDTKETIQYDDFAKLDLRVATITEAEAHPNADRLLKLQVDLGTEKRQICAGVKAFYDPENLVGKQIIIVANLAPRKIRGEESNGMLLAASAMDGEELKDVVLLAPSKEVPAGSSVG
ncbi:MAG: methionine--tRNA ligase subunit beta [Phycisphaeraceae bacterium]